MPLFNCLLPLFDRFVATIRLFVATIRLFAATIRFFCCHHSIATIRFRGLQMRKSLSQIGHFPPTLAVGPNGPFSDLRFTLTAPPQAGCQGESGQFSLIVRVGGRTCPTPRSALVRDVRGLPLTTGWRSGRCRRRGPLRQAAHRRRMGRSHMKRGLNQNLSGNEVYYTAGSSLVLLKNSCSEFHCHTDFNLIFFSHKLALQPETSCIPPALTITPID